MSRIIPLFEEQGHHYKDIPLTDDRLKVVKKNKHEGKLLYKNNLVGFIRVGFTTIGWNVTLFDKDRKHTYAKMYSDVQSASEGIMAFLRRVAVVD